MKFIISPEVDGYIVYRKGFFFYHRISSNIMSLKKVEKFIKNYMEENN